MMTKKEKGAVMLIISNVFGEHLFNRNIFLYLSFISWMTKLYLLIN